jgi:hypothetical protein
MIEIDVFGDDVLTLGQASKLLPTGRNGSKPHLSTLLRWLTQGAIARDGQRVRLSAVRYGGKWITSKAAIRFFVDRLTCRIDNIPPPTTPTKKRREDAEIAKELDEAGI